MTGFNFSAAPPFTAGGTLANLAAAIAARFGLATALSHLACDPLASAIKQSRNVVLLLFDGLGQAQTARLLANRCLAQAQTTVLDSVFPSSTAPAVTSLASGLSPASHAVTGWHLWWAERNAIVRPLPLDFRTHSGVIDPNRLFDWHPIARTLGVSMRVLQPASIAHSPFSTYAFGRDTRRAYSSIKQLRELITESVRTATPAGRYIYAYLPQFDSAAHEFGCESVEAETVALSFDKFFEQLSDDLKRDDALVIAAADHGFIDIPSDSLLRLEAFPELARYLTSPLTGEPRVAFCRVKPERSAEFVAAVKHHLGGAFDCVESRALIDAGWFGPTSLAHPRLHERVGAFTLIARDRYCITQTLVGEKPAKFIGMHGGVHPHERTIAVSATVAGSPLASSQANVTTHNSPIGETRNV